MPKLGHIIEDVIVAGDGTVAKNMPVGCWGFQVFNSAGNPRWQLCPKLEYAVWDNDGTFVDHTAIVAERGTVNEAAINAFNSSDDAYYIGCLQPFRGVYLDLENKNDTASVITVKYRKDDDTWADTSDTDGTDVAGDTLKQSGDIYWTPATDWIGNSVNGIGPLYYVQITVSATLDASVSINEIVPLSIHGTETMTIGPTAQNSDFQKGPIFFDGNHIGGIECTGNAGSEAISVWYYCAPSVGLIANV